MEAVKHCTSSIFRAGPAMSQRNALTCTATQSLTAVHAGTCAAADHAAGRSSMHPRLVRCSDPDFSHEARVLAGLCHGPRREDDAVVPEIVTILVRDGDHGTF